MLLSQSGLDPLTAWSSNLTENIIVEFSHNKVHVCRTCVKFPFQSETLISKKENQNAGNKNEFRIEKVD